MAWLGGFDMELMKSPASFWVVRGEKDSRSGDRPVVGVLSGHFGGMVRLPKSDSSPIVDLDLPMRSYRTRGLWVHPEYRGRGYARALMDAAIATAADERCNVIWTFPRKSSLPAYEKLGFKKHGEWTPSGGSNASEFGPNCYAYRMLAQDL